MVKDFRGLADNLGTIGENWDDSAGYISVQNTHLPTADKSLSSTHTLFAIELFVVKYFVTLRPAMY